MKVKSLLLMTAVCALCLPTAHAQTLNFTNDFSHVKGPNADQGLMQDIPETVHFPAGSGVWAVLSLSTSGIADINAFSGKPEGGGSLRKTIEMANTSGGFNLVSDDLSDVRADLGKNKRISTPIIPDKPNNTQQFNQLLDMIAAHKGTGPILIRVKISAGDGSATYSQNGFYLDVTNGLGRYADWIKQRGAAQDTAHDDFEKQHLVPRTAFVNNYRSLKTDPKFTADLRTWWTDKVGGSPLSTKVCSDSYILMRNNLGDVTEKQLCALITYKSETKCFVMMRRLSYRRLGKETFENELVDATYANQEIPADEGETFSGGHPYEIACKASK